MRLRDRAVKAAAWSLGSYGVELPIRFFSNLIMTRLLFPEAFGAFAAAAALIYGLVLIGDFGVRAVVIQSGRGDQVGFLRSAWTFQLWRGILIWLAVLGICGLIFALPIQHWLPTGSVFANHSFPLLAACMGFAVVLHGGESVCIALNARHLNYKPMVIIDLMSRVLSLPITITWAWVSPSVWALVAGFLASSLFKMVLSHLLLPGPWMGLSWDKDHWQEIVRVGKWIAVSSFVTIVSQQGEIILLGILVPGSALGLYSVAKVVLGLGENILDRLSRPLALPVLGEVIRKNPHHLRDRYYRFRLPIDLAAGVLSGCMFAAGNFVVSFLYDARYEQAGLMVQILALGTLNYPFSIIGNAFTATGDTHINASISALKAVALIGCSIIGYIEFGFLGAIGGVVLHRFIPTIAILFLARQRDWVSVWRELRIIPAFFVGLLLGKGVVLTAAILGLENIHQFLHFLTFLHPSNSRPHS